MGPSAARLVGSALRGHDPTQIRWERVSRGVSGCGLAHAGPAAKAHPIHPATQTSMCKCLLRHKIPGFGRCGSSKRAVPEETSTASGSACLGWWKRHAARQGLAARRRPRRCRQGAFGRRDVAPTTGAIQVSPHIGMTGPRSERALAANMELQYSRGTGTLPHAGCAINSINLTHQPPPKNKQLACRSSLRDLDYGHRGLQMTKSAGPGRFSAGCRASWNPDERVRMLSACFARTRLRQGAALGALLPIAAGRDVQPICGLTFTTPRCPPHGAGGLSGPGALRTPRLRIFTCGP